MKYALDFVVASVVIILALLSFLGGYYSGKEVLIEHCKTYSAFKISDEEAMLCVVKPLLKQGEGNLNYMRPEGKQVIKPNYKEI